MTLLVDTGPLVALLDEGDVVHRRIVKAMRRIREPLLTTWPVVTEAIYMLGDLHQAQDALLSKIEVGDLAIADLTAADAPAMRRLMAKYGDLPMDFADASLVRVAERDGLDRVFTLDRDFRVYRRDGGVFQIIP